MPANFTSRFCNRVISVAIPQRSAPASRPQRTDRDPTAAGPIGTARERRVFANPIQTAAARGSLEGFTSPLMSPASHTVASPRKRVLISRLQRSQAHGIRSSQALQPGNDTPPRFAVFFAAPFLCLG